MSWSIVIDNMETYPGLDSATLRRLAETNPRYVDDAHVTLAFARLAGFASCTLAGGRTPNPYGGDEILDLSIHGFTGETQFTSTMKHVVVLPQEGP